jgi:glutamate racemase
MTIGVFDSGVGGRSMANAVRKAFPGYEIELAEDSKNLPYGTKTPEQLLELTLPILRDLAKRCQVIVIACNTLTTNCIGELRKALPVPLIGLEPMVKPAAELTKADIIAVCATPATLRSQRYAYLKQTFAHDIHVLEPDCSRWAYLIETNQLDHDTVSQPIEEAIQRGADVIVLGCTHYHWIEELVRDIAAGRAEVLQPEQAVATQLSRVIKELERPA